MAAFYTFEDYSGADSNGPKSDNPYQDLIDSCNDDPALIQARYNTHRTNRNAQQKAKLSSPDFPGVTVDEILAKLEDPDASPGFCDPRHCLVFWARPPKKVRDLIAEVQRRLLEVAPSLWTMKPPDLHLTALEITHSQPSAAAIAPLVAQLGPHARALTDYTLAHRARLVRPLLSFDAQALALSYVPAAGEARADAYTYHHLRRDLFARACAAGVPVASRYVIPSAHLTVARFVSAREFETAGGAVDRARVAALLAAVDEINAWLQRDYWPHDGDGGTTRAGGEWVVGEEKGLEFRKGTLWYGAGGETVRLGAGF